MRFFIPFALLCISVCAQADEPDMHVQLQDYYFDAARRGDVAMLDTFIESGYALDTQDSKGYSALILAAYHGQSDAVEHLLAAGANACVQDLAGAR